MTELISPAAPESLILPSGEVQFGHFDGPVDSLGLAHFEYRNNMDKLASRWARHFHFKQFQFVSLLTPRYVIGVALADIGYVGSAFCYLYDIAANTLVETTWLKPFAKGMSMSPSPRQGKACIGGRRGSITFNLVDGLWQLSLETPQISAELELHPLALSLPMAMCTPTGYNGWTYTQKHNGLIPKGRLTIKHEPQPLNNALAGYDYSAGYMRRETSWRWASINARVGDTIIGLNLAAGVNETGATENVLWINGARHLLGPVQFDFLRNSDHMSDDCWRITSLDGRVDLRFKARNGRQEKLNLWLLQSNFRQYIGHFEGEVIDGEGQRHHLQQVLGLTEDHFARW